MRAMERWDINEDALMFSWIWELIINQSGFHFLHVPPIIMFFFFTALNRGTAKLIASVPSFVVKKPSIPEMEFSGVVHSVGASKNSPFSFIYF